MAAPMSDEEYGRAWCAMMGRVPVHDLEINSFGWWVSGETAADLPDIVYDWLMDDDTPFAAYYTSEAAAYAAVGRVVRAIHRQVPVVPGVV